MKSVIMTGATSFLGRNMLNYLLKKNYTVYVLVRKSSEALKNLPENKNLVKIFGTLENAEILKNYISQADYFIHYGWDGSGNIGRADSKIQALNVEYSMEILKSAELFKCSKFIFPGSQAEYGMKYDIIKEEDECRPISEYGKAKLKFGILGEQFARENNIQFIHQRIFSVYGFGDRKGTLVDECINNFNNGGKIILGACMQKWNYLYIDDYVKITDSLMEGNYETGIYNTAGYDTRILKEFVLDIYELSNKSGSFQFGNETKNPEGSPSLQPCIDKIGDIMKSIKATEFKDGIKNIMKAGKIL